MLLNEILNIGVGDVANAIQGSKVSTDKTPDDTHSLQVTKQEKKKWKILKKGITWPNQFNSTATYTTDDGVEHKMNIQVYFKIDDDNDDMTQGRISQPPVRLPHKNVSGELYDMLNFCVMHVALAVHSPGETEKTNNSDLRRTGHNKLDVVASKTLLAIEKSLKRWKQHWKQQNKAIEYIDFGEFFTYPSVISIYGSTDSRQRLYNLMMRKLAHQMSSGTDDSIAMLRTKLPILMKNYTAEDYGFVRNDYFPMD